MTKQGALKKFWSSFGLPAYDELTVSEKATFPYITYESRYDSYGENIALAGSVYYRSKSWTDIEEKVAEIGKFIGRGGVQIPYDDGCIWITRGTPFEQRMKDEMDSSVRRIVLNINAEYTSAD